MTPFRTLEGVAAPFPTADIDTDKIIPARFLKTVTRTGLGRHLFDGLRFDRAGEERPEFVLNREPYRRARLLVTFENFGCGSSREHAPWALLDFGIRCVLAPSFGDIFAANAVKNGLLPARLPRSVCERLMADTSLLVDLVARTVTGVSSGVFEFDIDPSWREALLAGRDDIGETLEREDRITAYESRPDVAPAPPMSFTALS